MADLPRRPHVRGAGSLRAAGTFRGQSGGGGFRDAPASMAGLDDAPDRPQAPALMTPATIPPPLAWAFSIGLSALAGWFVPPLRTVWFHSLWLAWAVALGALIWCGWAALEFRRHRTTILPQRQPTALLCRGPFRVSRNPLYLAMLLLAVVPWLGWGRIGLLLAPGLFFVFANWVIIPSEEVALRALFGDAYAGYCRRVRRWC